MTNLWVHLNILRIKKDGWTVSTETVHPPDLVRVYRGRLHRPHGVVHNGPADEHELALCLVRVHCLGQEDRIVQHDISHAETSEPEAVTVHPCEVDKVFSCHYFHPPSII